MLVTIVNVLLNAWDVQNRGKGGGKQTDCNQMLVTIVKCIIKCLGRVKWGSELALCFFPF